MSYFLAMCYALGTIIIAPKEEYKEYCNDRYLFCIKYPSTFTLIEKSDNGDGAFFTSADKEAQIWTYGRLAIEDLDKLEQEFKIATTNIKVSYQVKKQHWFVFSGTDKDGKIIYQKTVKKAINFLGDENTDVFQTLRISYPADKKDAYNSYCKIVSKSL